MEEKDPSQLVENSKKDFREAITWGYELLSQHDNVTGAIVNLEQAREYYGVLQNLGIELEPEYIHGLNDLEEAIKKVTKGPTNLVGHIRSYL